MKQSNISYHFCIILHEYYDPSRTERRTSESDKKRKLHGWKFKPKSAWVEMAFERLLGKIRNLDFSRCWKRPRLSVIQIVWRVLVIHLLYRRMHVRPQKTRAHLAELVARDGAGAVEVKGAEGRPARLLHPPTSDANKIRVNPKHHFFPFFRLIQSIDS